MSVTAEDKVAIAELCARFGFAIDAEDADAFVATFTADGVFQHPEGMYVGASELRRLVAESAGLPRRQHWAGTLVIEGDGDRATARSNGFVVEEIAAGTFGIAGFARQEYSLRRVDGQWLFERFEVHRPPKNVS